MSPKAVIQTVDNPNPEMPMAQRHIVKVPALCPITGNPQPGSTVTVTYLPGPKLLELYALTDYVRGYIGHQTIRDIEHFAQTLAQDCADQLGVAVSVRTHFVLDIDQIVQLRIRARPRC